MNIILPKERIAGFCLRHHMQKLAIFGSALRHDFGPDTDLDVLVEFDQAHVPGLEFLRWK